MSSFFKDVKLEKFENGFIYPSREVRLLEAINPVWRLKKGSKLKNDIEHIL